MTVDDDDAPFSAPGRLLSGEAHFRESALGFLEEWMRNGIPVGVIGAFSVNIPDSRSVKVGSHHSALRSVEDSRALVQWWMGLGEREHYARKLGCPLVYSVRISHSRNAVDLIVRSDGHTVFVYHAKVGNADSMNDIIDEFSQDAIFRPKIILF